jgi:hypothetical protein
MGATVASTTATEARIANRIKVRFESAREKFFPVLFDTTPAGMAAPAALLNLIV